MKLRFGRTGQAEPLPSGRLVTSLEAPSPPEAPLAPQAPVPQARPAPPASASARADHQASYGETSPKRPDGREGGPSEDLDALAARVLERLGQSPLPESLARIVAEVSERLVREEIARIREKSRTPPGSGA